MPLVDALSIASAYPLILILLSGIVLAEIPNARQIMAIVAGFVGVLFIIQPTGDHVDWIGAGAALFGCLAFAGLAVHTRYLSKTESSELMLLTGASCILVLSLISAPWTWQTPLWTWRLNRGPCFDFPVMSEAHPTFKCFMPNHHP